MKKSTHRVMTTVAMLVLCFITTMTLTTNKSWPLDISFPPCTCSGCCVCSGGYEFCGSHNVPSDYTCSAKVSCDLTCEEYGLNSLYPVGVSCSGSRATTTPFLTCLSEEIYGEDSEEVELLRYIRDNILHKTAEGQELIKWYYQWSPLIIKAIEEDEEFKDELKEIIEELLPMIEGEMN